MDTCQYCALSLSGFSSQEQRLVLQNPKNAYYLRNVVVLFPFAYEDKVMKLNLTPDSHVLLLLPHVQHIQFKKEFTINTLANIAQMRGDMQFLSHLYQEANQAIQLYPCTNRPLSKLFYLALPVANSSY